MKFWPIRWYLLKTTLSSCSAVIREGRQEGTAGWVSSECLVPLRWNVCLGVVFFPLQLPSSWIFSIQTPRVAVCLVSMVKGCESLGLRFCHGGEANCCCPICRYIETKTGLQLHAKGSLTEWILYLRFYRSIPSKSRTVKLVWKVAGYKGNCVLCI